MRASRRRVADEAGGKAGSARGIALNGRQVIVWGSMRLDDALMCGHAPRWWCWGGAGILAPIPGVREEDTRSPIGGHFETTPRDRPVGQKMETLILWVSGLLPLVLIVFHFVLSWRCLTLAGKALAQPGSDVKVRIAKGSVELAVSNPICAIARRSRKRPSKDVTSVH